MKNLILFLLLPIISIVPVLGESSIAKDIESFQIQAVIPDESSATNKISYYNVRDLYAEPKSIISSGDQIELGRGSDFFSENEYIPLFQVEYTTNILDESPLISISIEHFKQYSVNDEDSMIFTGESFKPNIKSRPYYLLTDTTIEFKTSNLHEKGETDESSSWEKPDGASGNRLLIKKNGVDIEPETKSNYDAKEFFQFFYQEIEDFGWNSIKGLLGIAHDHWEYQGYTWNDGIKELTNGFVTYCIEYSMNIPKSTEIPEGNYIMNVVVSFEGI